MDCARRDGFEWLHVFSVVQGVAGADQPTEPSI
jgi:hypothetical protein